MAHSEKTKQKLRDANLGKTHSDETKRKMSESRKGRTSGMKGKIHSEETKQKIREANLGRATSDEHRRNLSTALLGNKNCIGRKDSEETILKRSKSNKGKVRTDETKEKMRNAKLGKPGPWAGKSRHPETKKKISETLYGRFRREESPSWRGGCSPYGFEFNEKLKEIIRDRDGRKCRICGNSELENGKKLDCHHINYDKEDNNPKNLISLCHSCHTKTNHNRKKWTKYFDNLVNIYRDQFQEAIDEQ